MSRSQRSKPHRKAILRFKQSEVERAIRATLAMGLPVGRVEVDPIFGKISVITTGTPANAKCSPSEDRKSSWDKVLNHAED